MQVVQPLIAVRRLCASGQPQHHRHLVGPQHLIRLQVQIKNADFPGLLGQLQTVPGLFDGQLGAALLADILNHPNGCRAEAFHLEAPARQTRFKAAAIQAAQGERFAKLLARGQPRGDACREHIGIARCAKQQRNRLPLQLRCGASHERDKGRVELPKFPVTDQNNGRGIVKNGGLLLEQFIEQAFAPLNLFLRLDPLRHVLVQAHDSNAFAPCVKHGRQGGLVVIDRAVLAAIHELPPPGLPQKQRGPHRLVGLRWRLPTGHQRRFFAAHFVQRVARGAFVLGVDPVNAAIACGNHHRCGAVLQRSAQHPKALHRRRHARSAAQQVEQQQSEQPHQHERRSAHLCALHGWHQRADVIERHQLPGATRVVPVDALMLNRIRDTIEHDLRRIGCKR